MNRSFSQQGCTKICTWPRFVVQHSTITSNFDSNTGFSNLGYTYPQHFVTGVRKKCVDNENIVLTNVL